MAPQAAAPHPKEGPGPEQKARGEELNVRTLGELSIEPDAAAALQSCWKAFVMRAGSADVGGRAIFSALFETAPDIQLLFTAPKAMQAARFMAAMQLLVDAVGDKAELKVMVESLGFKHVSIDVNPARAMVLRDAILDVLSLALGDQLTRLAKEGFLALLNYVGGALIFIRSAYGERLRIISDSWRQAAEKAAAQQQQSLPSADSGGSGGSSSGEFRHPGADRAVSSSTGKSVKEFRMNKEGSDAGSGSSGEFNAADRHAPHVGKGKQVMPTTFGDMFQINAAVMGLQRKSMVWMSDVLETFDALVTNIANYHRLREECDVLVLRLSKHPMGTVSLPQFKACMLAALRSMLPRHWTTAHEDAWSWMWDSAAQMLNKNLGNPPAYESALNRAFEQMESDQRFEMRKQIYDVFFQLAPAGQDYFKQSSTRLHFISERVLTMSTELYHSPKRLVSEICSLGLRHVGFGIPIHLFPLFVTACVQVLHQHVDDEVAIEAFQWSVGLISKILMRTIVEGSTVVMRAINGNSVKQLRKAMDSAPRRSRATWLLDIQVGDQHISPLAWAIESGGLKVAEAILKDILTIRADRARYYYGVDELWERHPNIVKKLSDTCPMLLPPLLDGLVWRSHRMKDGMRRVNYYIKHVMVQADGTFSDALECVSASGDPTLVSHPTIALLADTLWSGVVVRQFISSRMWNVFSLLIFIMSQEVLPSWNDDGPSQALGWLIFAGRLFTYTVGMGRLAFFHISRVWLWCRRTMRRIIREIDTDGNGEIDWVEMMEALHTFKDTVQEEIQKALRTLREDDGPATVDEAKKAIANREKNMYNLISFSLMALLASMLTHEPIFWCAGAEEGPQRGWPTEYCQITGDAVNHKPLKYRYSVLAMSAMAVHWLILIDLAVFSTEISAFLLVCGHVLAEVKQFLTALAFLLLTFGSAISILCTHCPENAGDFSDVPNAMVSLFAITVGLYQGDYRNMKDDGLLLLSVSVFVTISVVLLLNLLVAQLNRSYEYIYKDMLGFARLNRASLIVDAMETCSTVRWRKFLESLGFEERLEFDEGDLGLNGGIASVEPAGLHRQTRESIRRFGGLALEDAPWPEDKTHEDDEAERLDRIERLVHKVIKRTTQHVNRMSSSQAGSMMDSWNPSESTDNSSIA